jgi:hypothetical protein
MADIAAKKTADTFKATSHPYRVLVVDDSAVIRGLLRKVLESDPAITVVNTVVNGQMALSAIQRQPVDVVVLDIEMPVMDGLTALPGAGPRGQGHHGLDADQEERGHQPEGAYARRRGLHPQADLGRPDRRRLRFQA